MKKERDEHELIYLYRQGDEEALQQLVKKYKRILYSIARRYAASTKTSCEIQDLYQVALIAFHAAIQTYKENMGSKFGTYVKVLVERAIFNALRHSYSDMSRANRESVSIDQEVRDQEGVYVIDTLSAKHHIYDPSKMYHHNYVYKKVSEELLQMPEISRKVFYLWSQGYSYRDISILCGLSEKKVDNVLLQVKKVLRNNIDIM